MDAGPESSQKHELLQQLLEDVEAKAIQEIPGVHLIKFLDG